jgi:23S rRNA pseudouridine2605 synthase
MPPRHTYWTILVNDQPTAFRAHDPEELLATLNRLKEKHPSAVMKWFERGRLWDSRDAAREVGLGKGERRWEGPRPDRTAGPAAEPPRDRSWRPGGDHRDPRQKYKDAKKAKWDRFKQNVRDRAERRTAAGPPGDPQKFSPPHGDPLRDKIEEAPPHKRPEGRTDQPDYRPGRSNFRPERRDFRPSGGQDRRGGWKPKPAPRGPANWTPNGPRASGDWRDRPPRDRERPERPEGPHRDWNDRPSHERGDGPRKPKPWGSKPGGFGGKKPWGTSPGGAGRPKAGSRGPGFRGPGRPTGKGPRGPGGKGPRGPRKPRGG